MTRILQKNWTFELQLCDYWCPFANTLMLFPWREAKLISLFFLGKDFTNERGPKSPIIVLSTTKFEEVHVFIHKDSSLWFLQDLAAFSVLKCKQLIHGTDLIFKKPIKISQRQKGD